MENIREYILSVTCAAVLCAVLGSFFEKKGTVGTLLKLISGLFLAFTVIRPVLKVDLTDLTSILQAYTEDAEAAAAMGEIYAREELSAVIKSEAESYILDKASSLGAELTANVTLSDDDIPLPAAVTLAGDISPYAKTVLSAQIEENLGIPKEDQQWTGEH